MKTNYKSNLDSITDRLLAALKSSNLFQQKLVAEGYADAVRQERERRVLKKDTRKKARILNDSDTDL